MFQTKQACRVPYAVCVFPLRLRRPTLHHRARSYPTLGVHNKPLVPKTVFTICNETRAHLSDPVPKPLLQHGHHLGGIPFFDEVNLPMGVRFVIQNRLTSLLHEVLRSKPPPPPTTASAPSQRPVSSQSALQYLSQAPGGPPSQRPSAPGARAGRRSCATYPDTSHHPINQQRMFAATAVLLWSVRMPTDQGNRKLRALCSALCLCWYQLNSLWAPRAKDNSNCCYRRIPRVHHRGPAILRSQSLRPRPHEKRRCLCVDKGAVGRFPHQGPIPEWCHVLQQARKVNRCDVPGSKQQCRHKNRLEVLNSSVWC